MRSGLALLLVVACSTDDGQRATDNGDTTFGFGRPATLAEIAAWDIDVMPDGTGLPEGEHKRNRRYPPDHPSLVGRCDQSIDRLDSRYTEDPPNQRYGRTHSASMFALSGL